MIVARSNQPRGDSCGIFLLPNLTFEETNNSSDPSTKLFRKLTPLFGASENKAEVMKIGTKSTKTTLVVQPNALGAELISVVVGLTPSVFFEINTIYIYSK
jgi:hypothetical protein